MNHILLLGAGFSRNWGGWTAGELLGDLLGRVADNNEVQRRLQNAKGGFEELYSELLGESRGRGTPEARAAFELFQRAITDSFEEMNQVFATRDSLNFSTDEPFLISRFLSNFDAIFTLNQDLLLELHYCPDGGNGHHWGGIYFPGVAPPDNWQTRDKQDMLRHSWSLGTTVPDEVPPLTQPIYKLHGSINWRRPDNTDVLVIGTNKAAEIQAQPVLRHYAEEFRRRLEAAPTRLMIIGYGFGDDHINQIIKNAAAGGQLSIFLVEPRGLQMFRPPVGIISERHWMLEVPIVGLSERPLSETFRADRIELQKFYRFLKPPPITV